MKTEALESFFPLPVKCRQTLLTGSLFQQQRLQQQASEDCGLHSNELVIITKIQTHT